MNKGQSTQSAPAAIPHTNLPNAITVVLSTMQIAIPIIIKTLVYLIILSLPYLVKKPINKAPIIVPRFVIDVITINQVLAYFSYQASLAWKTIYKLFHEAIAYPNWNIPTDITAMKVNVKHFFIFASRIKTTNYYSLDNPSEFYMPISFLDLFRFIHWSPISFCEIIQF